MTAEFHQKYIGNVSDKCLSFTAAMLQVRSGLALQYFFESRKTEDLYKNV